MIEHLQQKLTHIRHWGQFGATVAVTDREGEERRWGGTRTCPPASAAAVVPVLVVGGVARRPGVPPRHPADRTLGRPEGSSPGTYTATFHQLKDKKKQK